MTFKKCRETHTRFFRFAAEGCAILGTPLSVFLAPSLNPNTPCEGGTLNKINLNIFLLILLQLML